MSEGVNQTIFSFIGQNVTDVVSDILIPDIRRPLRPEVQSRKIEIPGRDGSWDFGPGAMRDFEIEVDFILKGTDSASVMSKARSLANMLSGKGTLYFSDEPSIKYQAQVVKQVSMNKRVFSYVQSGTIIFECDALVTEEPDENGEENGNGSDNGNGGGED